MPGRRSLAQGGQPIPLTAVMYAPRLTDVDHSARLQNPVSLFYLGCVNQRNLNDAVPGLTDMEYSAMLLRYYTLSLSFIWVVFTKEI